MNRRLIFDIETDGLDPSKIWIIAAQDFDTGETWQWSDYDDSLPPLNDFMPLFYSAKSLIGHNIIKFDLPAIAKVVGWHPGSKTTLIDTMLISQLNDFYRPHFNKHRRGKRGVHALDTWGGYLGKAKPDDPSWESYSEEMKHRCIEDVGINTLVYNHLLTEIKTIKETSPDFSRAIKLEHELAQEIVLQSRNGWLFDDSKAHDLVRQIVKRMAEIELEVEPQLKDRVIYIDAEPRTPKVLKNGKYDRVTRVFFNVETPSDNDGVPAEYQRTRIVKTDLGNNKAVIEFLLEQGWEPTEWNFKEHPDGTKEKRSPKLSDDSMDSIKGEGGKLVAEWRMLRSRKGFLEGQLKLQRLDGTVPCSGFIVGTNTRRMRHTGIVNVPGASALLGKEVRACYTSRHGYKIVAADSDANQLRGLGHYLNNPEIAKAMVEGKTSDGTDIHSRNADIIGVTRDTVKGLTYALIFGAGDPKLAETARMPRNKGKFLRSKMMEAYDGFLPMLANMEEQWSNHFFHTGRGYGISLDGAPIFCDKWRLLNALLQAFEAVVCKAATVKAMKMIRSEGLDARLICFYHDEINLEVREDHAQRAAEILEYALGPFVTEEYNLNILMSAESSIGNNWLEVH